MNGGGSSILDGPIAPRQPALSFDELAQLRDITREIVERSSGSLREYRDDASGGFFHVLDADAPEEKNDPGDYSKASTATVVTFLVRTGRWKEIAGDDVDAAQALLDLVLAADAEWTSAELPLDNAFTVGFKLELAGALLDAGATLREPHLSLCAEKLETLSRAIEAGHGRVRIEQPELVLGEVPNSYLAQLAVRVLQDWEARDLHQGRRWLTPELIGLAWDAATASANREVALLHADPLAADVFELGYALLVGVRTAPPDLRPTQRHLLRDALAQFFEAQRSDGSWPRGRRLFSYPRYGNAYCYDAEFLSQLLAAFPDNQILLRFLPQLQRAVDHLTREAVGLPGGGIGWSSGHHRQLHYPESWSTASGFDVCHRIDRLVASAVTDAIVEDLHEPRVALAAPPSRQEFDRILDAPIDRSDTERESFKDVLERRFIRPIDDQAGALKDGKPLDRATALSAIIYGPPGTSKTQCAYAISRAIGWELVTIDPSHLLRSGFDGLVVELSRLFGMLAYAERVVVFFDEIDELVRTRTEETEEAASRFLTTSMLPRLYQLRKSRRLIFIVATNHLEDFDTAIARPGRFDLVIPAMPPTAAAKLAEWKDVKTALDRVGLSDAKDQLERIEELTYDEFAAAVPTLVDAADGLEFSRRLEAVWNRGTLSQPAGRNQTWRDLIKGQRGSIRT